MSTQPPQGSSLTVSDPQIAVARCQEIQACLGPKEVPEFDDLVIMGMAVRTAVHIRGLPIIPYEVLRMVCSHYLGIPASTLKRVIDLLAEIEFVILGKEGKTIKSVTPVIPYYEDLYSGLGEYMSQEVVLSEPEQLALAVVDRLASSPEKSDRLKHILGADEDLFKRNMDVGIDGGFLYVSRHRGRDVIVNPTFFTENAGVFADHVAARGSSSVSSVMGSLKSNQGWPLELIERQASLGDDAVDPSQIQLLKSLAQGGIISPPSIETPHAGTNHFLFTPPPAASHLAPTKRDIYEKAMAIVAAIRQGQLMPAKYAIRNPKALISKLKSSLKLSAQTTEFAHQYKNLVHMRIARVTPTSNGFSEFSIINTEENKEALDIAYDLITAGSIAGRGVDEDARKALQSDLKYIESLVSSAHLREREAVALSEEQREQMDDLFLGFGAQ